MLFLKPLKHNLGAATSDNPTYKYCNPIKSSFRRNPIPSFYQHYKKRGLKLRLKNAA